MEAGPPDLAPAKKAHKKLLASGAAGAARALEKVIINKTWCGDRAAGSNSKTSLICIRCAKCNDTPMHRYYECSDNHNIDHALLKKTNWIVKNNNRDLEPEVKGCRAMLPYNLVTAPVG